MKFLRRVSLQVEDIDEMSALLVPEWNKTGLKHVNNHEPRKIELKSESRASNEDEVSFQPSQNPVDLLSQTPAILEPLPQGYFAPLSPFAAVTPTKGGSVPANAWENCRNTLLTNLNRAQQFDYSPFELRGNQISQDTQFTNQGQNVGSERYDHRDYSFFNQVGNILETDSNPQHIFPHEPIILNNIAQRRSTHQNLSQANMQPENMYFPNPLQQNSYADFNFGTNVNVDHGAQIRQELSKKFLRLVEDSSEKKQQTLSQSNENRRAVDQEEKAEVFMCKFDGCNRQFSWAWALKEHEKKHVRAATKSRDFKCEDCGKAFFTKSCLKSHTKIHTRKPGSYKCKAANCTKTYSTSEGLRLHVRNHHQVDKRWKCPVDACSKQFVRQSDMRLHVMRIHSATRPHPCRSPGCKKSFACFSELRRHEESHARKEKKRKAGMSAVVKRRKMS